MPLVQRVLAATEGDEYGAKAVRTGAALARRAGAEFEIVSVVEVLMLPPVAAAPMSDGVECEDALMRDALNRAQTQAREADAADAPVHVRSGFPAPLINRVAADRDADLIVLGGHPHTAITRFLVGSTAERTIRRSAAARAAALTRMTELPAWRAASAPRRSRRRLRTLRMRLCSQSPICSVKHRRRPASVRSSSRPPLRGGN